MAVSVDGAPPEELRFLVDEIGQNVNCCVVCADRFVHGMAIVVGIYMPHDRAEINGLPYVGYALCMACALFEDAPSLAEKRIREEMKAQA